MAELQDHAISSVTATLKSLRTHAGLREERLHGTTVVLDPLTSLDSVRALTGTGKNEKQAIVCAVRAAALTLQPTMSIVADASLGLELFADQVSDADLYAQDVGKRREALLRNWDQLHELQSVAPVKAPSPRALRLEVESAALTALAVALTTGASTGEPASGPVRVNQSLGTEPPPEAGPVGEEAPTLLETFRDVAKALRNSLTKDEEGRTGWRLKLHEPPSGPTAVSTAYGIRTMLLLEDGLAADLIPVAESLSEMAHPSGGYKSSGQARPSAESTAVVLNALRRIAPTGDFGVHRERMEKDLDDFEKSRPFILTAMLETSLLFGSESKFVKVLIDSLLAARRSYGDLLLWPERAESGLVNPAASVAHTARAVRVLADVQSAQPASQVQEALEQAVAWLIEQPYEHNPLEDIKRPSDQDGVTTHHFTAAWVVKALVSAGKPATDRSVQSAISRVWSNYGGDAVALWASNNGELPIWMTFDAIEALHLASRAAARPIPLR